MAKIKFGRLIRHSEGVMTAPTGSAADGLDVSSTELTRDGAGDTHKSQEAPLSAFMRQSVRVFAYALVGSIINFMANLS